MNQSQTTGALAAALAKAQGQISVARKDAENPFFKSRYADLASVWEACRAALSSNGLAVVQTTEGTATDTVTLCTTLLHASGEWISGVLTAKPIKADPQSLGSCITYLRRYALSAIVGVAPSDGTDDDGQAASQPTLEHVPQLTIHERLLKLVPSESQRTELRDYLRAVASKSGQYALQPDQELSDLTPELCAYMVSNWSKVRESVDKWAGEQDQIPGAEIPAPSTWRNAILPFAPKDHPELKGKTIGEAFENRATHDWAFGMLSNFQAKPYTGKDGKEYPPSKISLEFAVAGANWRRENNRPEPDQE